MALGTWLRGCTSFPNNQESDTGMLMVTESFPRFQQNAYADSEVLPVRPRTGFAHPQPSIPPTHPDQGWAILCEQATPSPLESDTERSLFQKTSVQAFLWKGGVAPLPVEALTQCFHHRPHPHPCQPPSPCERPPPRPPRPRGCCALAPELRAVAHRPGERAPEVLGSVSQWPIRICRGKWPFLI